MILHGLVYLSVFSSFLNLCHGVIFFTTNYLLHRDAVARCKMSKGFKLLELPDQDALDEFLVHVANGKICKEWTELLNSSRRRAKIFLDFLKDGSGNRTFFALQTQDRPSPTLVFHFWNRKSLNACR